MHSSGDKELEDEWILVVRGKKKKQRKAQPKIAKGWDASKCTFMPEFSDEMAEAIVEGLSFRKPEYLTTSDAGKTRYAYQYYYAPGGAYRLCVCVHIHYDRNVVGYWVPGHAFICGWTGWQMDTPWSTVDVLTKLEDGGTFPPEDQRYPQE